MADNMNASSSGPANSTPATEANATPVGARVPLSSRVPQSAVNRMEVINSRATRAPPNWGGENDPLSPPPSLHDLAVQYEHERIRAIASGRRPYVPFRAPTAQDTATPDTMYAYDLASNVHHAEIQHLVDLDLERARELSLTIQPAVERRDYETVTQYEAFGHFVWKLDG